MNEKKSYHSTQHRHFISIQVQIFGRRILKFKKETRLDDTTEEKGKVKLRDMFCSARYIENEEKKLEVHPYAGS